MSVAVPRLTHNLSLIDTPGIRSLIIGHPMITIAMLERTDALVFVLCGTGEFAPSEPVFLYQATERYPSARHDPGG
jgi:hypothetical protein